MKHVCHITTVHPSGDVRIFHKECTSLARAGYRVTYLVINGESFTEDGVEVIGVPCHFKGRLQRFQKATKIAYQKAVEIDAGIYHFHDPEFLPYAAKLIKKGKKVIYDVHEDLPRQIYSKYYIWKPLRAIAGLLAEIVENHYSSKMSCIITATSHIGDRFSKRCNWVVTINNYPKMSEVTDNITKIHAGNICYVGGVTRARGLSELIRSLESTEIKLILAGPFSPESYKGELMRLSGWKKVEYVGFANRNEVQEIFSRSLAGVVTFHPEPNHIFSQPNKMFEYMAGGLPVIASDFPLWREIIQENNCGICVDPLNPQEIASAIDRLRKDPERAKKMGENGRNAVIQKYNWENEEMMLLDTYKRLLND